MKPKINIMKTQLAGLLAMVAIAMTQLAAHAELTEMTLRVPKFTGAVRVTTGDVNLRKAPSASSPRLVNDWPEEDEGGDSRPETLWSDANLLRGYERVPVYGVEGQVLPALGQSDGWTHILADGYYGLYLTPAWIKDSFIDRYSLEPFPAVSGEWEKLFVRADGVYKDFCMMFYSSEVMYAAGLAIGYVSGNVAVLPLDAHYAYSYNPNARGLSLTKDEYGSNCIVFGPDCSVIIGEDSRVPDLNKLTDAQVWEIISQAEPNYFELVLYRAANQYGGLFLQTEENLPAGILETRTVRIPRPQPAASASSGAGSSSAADREAEFPGGLAGLMKWLGAHQKYPEMAQLQKIQGRVVVQFVIEADGTISDAKIIRSADPLLDGEALRVIKAMPKWNPAVAGGRPIKSIYTLPITFKLN